MGFDKSHPRGRLAVESVTLEKAFAASEQRRAQEQLVQTPADTYAQDEAVRQDETSERTR